MVIPFFIPQEPASFLEAAESDLGVEIGKSSQWFGLQLSEFRPRAQRSPRSSSAFEQGTFVASVGHGSTNKIFDQKGRGTHPFSHGPFGGSAQPQSKHG